MMAKLLMNLSGPAKLEAFFKKIGNWISSDTMVHIKKAFFIINKDKLIEELKLITDFDDKSHFAFMNYVLMGFNNPDTGFSGEVRRIQTILDEVPKDKRKAFTEFVRTSVGKAHPMENVTTDYYEFESPEAIETPFIRALYKSIHDSDVDEKLASAWRKFEKLNSPSEHIVNRIPLHTLTLLRQVYEWLTKYPTFYDMMTSTFYTSPYTMKVMSDIVHGKFEFDSKEANDKFLQAINLDTVRSDDATFVARELKRLLTNFEQKEKVASLENNTAYKKFADEFAAIPDLKTLRKIKFNELQKVLDNIPGCQKLSTEQFHKFCVNIEQILNIPGHAKFFASDFYSARFYVLFELLDKDTQENLAHLIYEAATKWIENEKKIDKKVRELVPPEAEKDAPFEEYVFADQRQGKVPNEPNTYDEDQMFEALVNHFNDNVPISVEEVKQIKILLKNGNYKNIFHEPDTTYVYRGMNGIKQEWLQNAVGEERWAKYASKYGPESVNKDLGVEEGDFVYTPRVGGSSAWSVDEAKAVEFAKSKLGGIDRSWFSVCLIARVAENPNAFVTGPEGLYKVKQFANNDEEKEAIGLGELKINKIIWRLSKNISAADVKGATSKSTKKKKDV